MLFDGALRKTVTSWRDEKEATPLVSSHALTRDHLLATTLRGELIAFDIQGKAGAKAFRFQTPNGKGIGAAPVDDAPRGNHGTEEAEQQARAEASTDPRDAPG